MASSKDSAGLSIVAPDPADQEILPDFKLLLYVAHVVQLEHLTQVSWKRTIIVFLEITWLVKDHCLVYNVLPATKRSRAQQNLERL